MATAFKTVGRDRPASVSFQNLNDLESCSLSGRSVMITRLGHAGSLPYDNDVRLEKIIHLVIPETTTEGRCRMTDRQAKSKHHKELDINFFKVHRSSLPMLIKKEKGT